MIVLVWAVGSVHSQTLRDTIHTVSRNYYYDSSWYTQCCTYYYDSVSPRDRMQLDLCQSEFYNLSGMHYLCKKFSTEYPLTIKGLSCMSPRNLWDTSCTYGTFPMIFQMSPDATPQVPDYLYLFQYDSVDGKLQMYDSVRWDTATAKVLELSLHSDPAEGYCYTYVYEVMLHIPVTVTGDFYVAGSRWNTAVDSMGRHLHYPRVYQMFQYLLVDYYQQGDDWHYSEAYCFPRNNGFLYPRHLDSLFTSQVSNDYYRYLYPKLFGPFFPIVDSWLVEINTSDSTLGRVWPNSGYYPDSTICNIVARPTRAGRFLGWSDGVLSPTRVERVTSDITLTAYFEAKDTCYVRAVSGNGHWGTVAGGGMYFDGDTVTLFMDGVTLDEKIILPEGTVMFAKGDYDLTVGASAEFSITTLLTTLRSDIDLASIITVKDGWLLDCATDGTTNIYRAAERGVYNVPVVAAGGAPAKAPISVAESWVTANVPNATTVNEVEAKLAAVGVEVVYFPYTQGTSSTLLADRLRAVVVALPGAAAEQ